LYRVTCTLTVASASTHDIAVEAICAGGATAYNATFFGGYSGTNASADTTATLDFIWPFLGSGTSGNYPTSVSFKTVSDATLSAIGASTPAFYTYATMEYIGSAGTF
jgi:hypothetical protein